MEVPCPRVHRQSRPLRAHGLVEGCWDNRGAGAGLALLSIPVSSLTSTFLAKEGTEKHNPHSSSPASLPQTQHASCCWLLHREWEFGLVTPLFSVGAVALGVQCTAAGSTPVSCLGLLMRAKATQHGTEVIPGMSVAPGMEMVSRMSMAWGMEAVPGMRHFGDGSGARDEWLQVWNWCPG